MIEQHFLQIHKSAPKIIYFLTDIIGSHLGASLESEIGKCHQSQTWLYQGAAVLRSYHWFWYCC